MSDAVSRKTKYPNSTDDTALKKRKCHGPAGGKLTSHGPNYQLSLLMYTLLRGVRMGLDFCLGAEVSEAGKFDDLVFGYSKEVCGKEKWVYRLVQMKHKSDPKKSKIKLSALTSKDPKSEFGLPMYFRSFCDIKANFTKIDEEIGDVIIYTNGKIEEWDSAIIGNIGKETIDEVWQTQLHRFAEGKRRKWAKGLIENSTGTKEDVDLFLNKFSMAIDQPEEEELNEKVLEELKVSVIINVHEAYSHFHTHMHKWLSDKKCFYLYRKDCLKLIEGLVCKYGRFKFRVDRPVQNFSGREKELDDLKKAFEGDHQKVVICGLGGVGKTQLARMFVERHSDSHSCVIWMASESYEDLKTSFQRLAFYKLEIKEKTDDGKVKDIVSILEEVKQALQNRKTFFIFDNVRYIVDGTTGRSDLNVFLQKLPDNATLLMTSRYRDWNNFFVFPLEPLSDDDANMLIRKSLKDVTINDEQVKNLAKETQNYPLALQQAIAYIKKKSKDAKRLGGVYSIDSYLETFRENYQQLLEHPVQDLNGEDNVDYFKTTLTTWDMTMEDIKNEKKGGALSKNILEKISYFYADGISISDIIQCACEEEEEDVKTAILLLDDYSMVNLLNGQCTVHRLVQKISRWRLKENEKEHELLDSMLDLCMKLNVRNVVSLWEHCAVHKYLIRKHSKMPKEVIWSFIVKGGYSDGHVYGKRLVEVMETTLAPMDESVNAVNYALALVSYMNGLYNESYEVFKKVWEQSCVILGEEHPDTLTTRNQMALVLSALGRRDESQDILNKLSEKCERKLDRESEDSINSRLIYSISLRELGKYVESYNVIKEVCDTSERLFGQNHAYFINARYELALGLLELYRYDESLEILINVWEWERSEKGEEHPDTLISRYYMGLVQFELRKYAESLEIFETVYECERRSLGEEHLETLGTGYYIGRVLFKLCKYAKSLRILGSVYKCERKTLGEKHPTTLNTRKLIELVIKRASQSANSN